MKTFNSRITVFKKAINLEQVVIFL